MTRLTVTRHRVERDEWERSQFACPKCARREMWAVAEPSSISKLAAGVYTLMGGALHVCASCKRAFRISVEHDTVPRAVAALRELQRIQDADDEEAARVVKELFRKWLPPPDE